MSNNTAIKQRRQQMDYLNLTPQAEIPSWEFMGPGVTELNEEPGAQAKTKRYINDASASSSISGYEPKFPINAEQMMNQKAIKYIVDIGKYRKTGAEAETQYLTVDVDEPVEGSANTFNARFFNVSVEVSSFSDDEGEYTCEGSFNQKGDLVKGTFNTETLKFTPDGSVVVGA